jgi:uncharacterized protein DUF763
MTPSAGPKTLRAVVLVAELVYGAPASTRDPARFAFAHDGKDGMPSAVDRDTYERTIVASPWETLDEIRRWKASGLEDQPQPCLLTAAGVLAAVPARVARAGPDHPPAALRALDGVLPRVEEGRLAGR